MLLFLSTRINAGEATSPRKIPQEGCAALSIQSPVGRRLASRGGGGADYENILQVLGMEGKKSVIINSARENKRESLCLVICNLSFVILHGSFRERALRSRPPGAHECGDLVKIM